MLHRFIYGSFSGSYIGLLHPTSIVSISNKVHVRDRLILWRGASLIVEGTCVIDGRITVNDFSRIVVKDSVTFEGDALIAQMVTILDHDHYVEGTRISWGSYTTAPIKVGGNVWLGDKVTILKGVTVGDNVIVGANSVVSRDLESNGIFAGSPATKVKVLIDEY